MGDGGLKEPSVSESDVSREETPAIAAPDYFVGAEGKTAAENAFKEE